MTPRLQKTQFKFPALDSRGCLTKNIFPRAGERGTDVPKKTKEQLRREDVKKSLLAQLQTRNVNEAYYTDLIGDYMDLWDTKNKLIRDISDRGVMVPYTTAAGTNLRKNDSVSELVKVSTQMLKILDSLRIEPVPEDGSERDEEM